MQQLIKKLGIYNRECGRGNRTKCFTVWEAEKEKGRKTTGKSARGKEEKEGQEELWGKRP